MEPTFSTRWFYRHFTGLNVSAGKNICAVCGLPCEQGASTYKVIRPTFTDHAALRAPRSPVVCAACEWYMANQDLRRKSWWLHQNEAVEVDKGQWHALLLHHLADPPALDSYYLITTMKRKHLALYAPLNMAHNTTLRARFEVTTLDICATWPALVNAAHELRTRHPWKEIQADSYNSYFAAQWPDLARFAQLRALLRPYLNTPYLDLAQFVWSNDTEPTQEEDSEDE